MKSKQTRVDFTRILIRECFSCEELSGSTIGGKNCFGKLNVEKINFVKSWVFKKLPPMHGENLLTEWSVIQNAVDTSLRKVMKKRMRKSK